MADIIDFDTATPAEATLQTVRSDLTGWFHHSRATFENVDRFVRGNPHGLSPQEAFDALGTRAGNCVSVLVKIAQTLNQFAPPKYQVASSKPAGVTLKTNPDGTVTVNGA